MNHRRSVVHPRCNQCGNEMARIGNEPWFCLLCPDEKESAPETTHFKPGDIVRTVDPTEFDCPFCSGAVVYGRTADDETLQVVSHAFPMCQKFVVNNGADFIRLCVTAIESRIN